MLAIDARPEQGHTSGAGVTKVPTREDLGRGTMPMQGVPDGRIDMAAAVLRDGTEVELRTMQPADADALVRFHATLSDDTTLGRFFVVHRELTAQELHRFTHVDHRDREALVAVSDGEILGVARFDRLPDRTAAEVAFVVSDSWRGRGLGSVLFQRLVRLARTRGVDHFRAEVLATNARMLRLFSGSGLPQSVRRSGSVVHVDLALHGVQSRHS
jgi:GNAT superfamily N-acetyltransferase